MSEKTVVSFWLDRKVVKFLDWYCEKFNLDSRSQALERIVLQKMNELHDHHEMVSVEDSIIHWLRTGEWIPPLSDIDNGDEDD